MDGAMSKCQSEICPLCLSSQRTMFSVQDFQWAYNLFTDTQNLPSDTRVCWECRAAIRKLLRFRAQARQARHILETRARNEQSVSITVLKMLASCRGKHVEIAHYTTNTMLDESLSCLCVSMKYSHDAHFIFDETSNITSDTDRTMDFKEIIPKEEVEVNEFVTESEIWADLPEYSPLRFQPDVKVSPDEIPTAERMENVPRKVCRPRGRPRKKRNGAKFESFAATDVDVSTYRQRAFRNLQMYSFTCISCVAGFITEEKLIKHNAKHHSETVGPHTCDVCSSRCPDAESLRVHRAGHFTMYRCKFTDCGFTHPSSSNVRSHYATHEPRERSNKMEALLNCDLCEKRFRSAQGLAVHRQTHTSERTYECHHCGKIFKTRTQIHLHMPHHTLKVMCDVCGKQLPNHRRLKVHALAHLDPSHRPQECKECHKRFIDKYKLIVHSRQHTGEKPFKCRSCVTEYVSKEQLTQHLKKYHSDSGAKITSEFKPRTKSLFRNERIFPGKQQKRVTVKQENDAPKEVATDKFKCNICGKNLSTYQNLQSHFGVHSNERPVKCDECDRTFKYKPQLYAHKLRHRGEKPHQCTLCGSRFAFKTILNTHLKSHSNEKLFKCDECDLTFKYNSGLWTHKLIHKGEKPHQCTVCGARFTLKGNLTGHMKTHTNDKPFECNFCGRKFPWRRNLRNHMKTHAKEQRTDETRLLT